MKRDDNRCLFSRLPGKSTPVYPAVGWIVDTSLRSRANIIYSPGSDKLTEVQLHMSTSFQPGSQIIRAFSDVGKPFAFSDLSVKAAKSEKPPI